MRTVKRIQRARRVKLRFVLGRRFDRGEEAGGPAVRIACLAALAGAVSTTVGCGSGAASGKSVRVTKPPTVSVAPAGGAMLQPVAPAPTGDPTSSTLQPFRVATEEVGQHGDVTVTLEFPSFRGATQAQAGAAARLTAAVRATMLAGMRDFEAHEADSAQSVAAGTPPWSLGVQCHVAANSGELVSLACTEHSYLGGVHLNQRMIGHSYLVSPEKVTRLGLADLFRAPDEALRWLADYCMKDLRRQGAQGVVSGTVTDLTKLLEEFALTDGGLALFFPPYSVAPHSDGSFTVIVPLAVAAKRLDPTVRRACLGVGHDKR